MVVHSLFSCEMSKIPFDNSEIPKISTPPLSLITATPVCQNLHTFNAKATSSGSIKSITFSDDTTSGWPPPLLHESDLEIVGRSEQWHGGCDFIFLGLKVGVRGRWC